MKYLEHIKCGCCGLQVEKVAEVSGDDEMMQCLLTDAGGDIDYEIEPLCIACYRSNPHIRCSCRDCLEYGNDD